MSKLGHTENRLARESSPYLLLHRTNPVDWYPWREEALARARAEDKPIFLSVGYSTCHWCHVMERESFSDPEIAELMNRDFVNIKVDREERPDLDEIYMVATQILTSHGGWPNSVFLTPDLKPFHAGTYFPPRDRDGMPGFPSVLATLAGAWENRRDDVERQANELAEAIGRHIETRPDPSAEPPERDSALRALDGLTRGFDAVHGGFGAAPKFPTPSNLWLLLELADREPKADEMLAATLDGMARGGIYDQLAGGFHRYATDAAWKVPHFEKMLHDNALLLEVYARWAARTRSPQANRIVRETARFLAVEMSGVEGGFASAIDADSEGREGAYYVWTRDQLHDTLGAENATFLGPLLGFDGSPFFEDDGYVLNLPAPFTVQAERRKLQLEELLCQVAPLRERLRRARDRREWPAVDDKVLADWNGMAIAALAVAGRVLDEPELARRAAEAAAFVLREMRPGGSPLQHTWRQGRATVPAFLADYAHVVRGLIELHRGLGGKRWLAAAVELAEEQELRLADPTGGYFTVEQHDDLLFRGRDVFDGAVPGANAVVALNCVALAEITGEEHWRQRAAGILTTFGGFLERAPDAVRTLAVAVLRFHGDAAQTPARPATSRRHDAEAGPVDVLFDRGAPGDDGWRSFTIRLRIAPDWHLQAADAAGDAALPTSLRGRGAELRAVSFPPADHSSNEPDSYVGEVAIEGEARPEDGVSAVLIVRFQACRSGRCFAPTEVELPLDPPPA